MQLWLSEAVEVEVTAKKETGTDLFLCLGLMQEVNFVGPLQHSTSVYR